VAFVPTQRFLLELAQKRVPAMTNYIYLHGGLGMENGTSLCVWSTSFKDCRIQFDSIDELFALMKNTTANDLQSKRNACVETAVSHRVAVLNEWRNIFYQSFLKVTEM
jgi:hypothetical protein